jgi:histidinol-phosphate aminotransferase
VLDAALRAFGEPGDRVAIPEPTFSMAATFARANSLEPVFLPLGPSYQPDPAAIASTGARVVYLCSPNNPLGTTCSPHVVEEVARATDGLVIVDEAYAEFAGASFVPLVARCGNLLVVRTMSKAFGLAGLRVGYAVGRAETVREIERSRGPFQVGALGVAAACAALDGDREWVRCHVTTVRAERERLADAFRARRLEPLPSAGNFVLVPVRDASTIAEIMCAQGVAVRAYDALRAVSPPLAVVHGQALRFTIGPRAEMDAALSAFDAARTVLSCA